MSTQTIEFKVTGFDPISAAISDVASAIKERDKLIGQAMASGVPEFTAWAISELKLRQEGNDVLSGLGAPIRWIAKQIGKLDD